MNPRRPSQTAPRWMPQRAKRGGVLAPAWLVVLVVSVTACTGLAGTRIVVENHRKGALQDIRITYDAGSRTRERLKAGGKYRTRIEPKGKSDLEIAFTDTNGERRSRKLGAHLDPAYRGEVRIEVDPTGRIGWEEHLEKR